MGLQQFFGILTSIDCSENMIMVGLAALVIGVMVGAIGYHFLRNWD